MIKKRFQYSEQSMLEAIRAVKQKGESVSSASRRYNVPRSTLFGKLGQKNPELRSVGPGTILSSEEENDFANWILAMAKVGFPITKDQLLDSVQKFIIKNKRETCFTNNRPGRKWYARFLQRHPTLVIRRSQRSTKGRPSTSESKIRKWFNEIHMYLKSEGLDDVLLDPSRVWTTDESALYLCPEDDNVMVRKGTNAVYSFVSNDDKECLTTLVTGNATGLLAPPMVVFKYQRLPPALLQSVPDGWGVGKSDTGWMTTSTFYEYITNVFHPWLLQNQIQLPVIIFMDGHSSNLSVELSTFCKNNLIILLALCSNSTHMLQPLDVAFFEPLKMEWKTQIDDYRIQNDGLNIQRENFAPLLDVTLSKLDKSLLSNGFRATGLHPFDPNAIDYQNYSANVDSAEIESVDVPSVKVEQVDELPSTENHFSQDDVFLLRALEDNIGDKLDTFVANGGSLRWNGNVRDQSLFELWMKLKIRVGEINL